MFARQYASQAVVLMDGEKHPSACNVDAASDSIHLIQDYGLHFARST